MSWATKYIDALLDGAQTVEFTPRGDSMAPRIKSGQFVTVSAATSYAVNDIVLCKVNGRQFLHRILAVDPKGKRFQIGNNRGGVNGWTPRENIYGKVVRVQDAPRKRRSG